MNLKTAVAAVGLTTVGGVAGGAAGGVLAERVRLEEPKPTCLIRGERVPAGEVREWKDPVRGEWMRERCVVPTE